MTLKRSVSPDGRIDSLSVEFCCPVDGQSEEDINGRAATTLRLQSEIVGQFLTGNGGSAQAPKQRQVATNGGTDAQMLGIGGLDTRWGRRLFINVQVNGRTLKLFGSPTQLGNAIAAAGYPDLTEFVEEGRQLNLPCRVTTRPSEDGRYQNIDRVLPASPNGPVEDRR